MKALGFLIAPIAAITFALPLAGTANAGPAGKHAYGGGGIYKVATYTPRINQRIKNQRRRIARGIRNGDLRRGEANRLVNRLRTIKQARRFAARDGVVTFRERARLTNMLDRNSRVIRRLKNNRRVAF
ncbi:MAG: hypothetical protein AAFV45_07435 [Pseudomonadota bacterium]